METLTISKQSWNKVLLWCHARDVEAGETPEYIYSTRPSKGTITIWTQPGWRGNYNIARIVALPKDENVYELDIIPGTAPPEVMWSGEKLIRHLKEIAELSGGKLEE